MNWEVKNDEGSRNEIVCKVSDPQWQHSISDAEACRAFDTLQQSSPRFRGILGTPRGTPLFLDHLSLAGHALGDRAVRSLVEALLACEILVGTVELYKNQLGDAAAQALSVLVQHAPAPGVRGLHLSHNYIKPDGVLLIIRAAVACGHYPRRQDRPEAAEAAAPANNGRYRAPRSTLSPLWLRVENQLIQWPRMDSPDPNEQVKSALSLVKQKGEQLQRQCQRDGSLPQELPDDFRLLCIPEPLLGWGSMEGVQEPASDSQTILPVKEMYRSICSSWQCRWANQYGPAVHLPYFWSQNAGDSRRRALPPHANLKAEDKYWTKWRPRVRGLLAKEAAMAAAKAAKMKEEEKSEKDAEDEMLLEEKEELPMASQETDNKIEAEAVKEDDPALSLPTMSIEELEEYKENGQLAGIEAQMKAAQQESPVRRRITKKARVLEPLPVAATSEKEEKPAETPSRKFPKRLKSVETAAASSAQPVCKDPEDID